MTLWSVKIVQQIQLEHKSNGKVTLLVEYYDVGDDGLNDDDDDLVDLACAIWEGGS